MTEKTAFEMRAAINMLYSASAISWVPSMQPLLAKLAFLAKQKFWS